MIDTPERFGDAAVADTFANLGWWDLFRDPALRELIETALAEDLTGYGITPTPLLDLSALAPAGVLAALPSEIDLPVATQSGNETGDQPDGSDHTDGVDDSEVVVGRIAPDVVALQKIIEEEKRAPEGGNTAVAPVDEDADLNPVYQQIRVELSKASIEVVPR